MLEFLQQLQELNENSADSAGSGDRSAALDAGSHGKSCGYVFQQNSAPARAAKRTDEWCWQRVHLRWTKKFWSPNSLDPNPLYNEGWDLGRSWEDLQQSRSPLRRGSEVDHSGHTRESGPCCREACVKQAQDLAGEDGGGRERAHRLKMLDNDDNVWNNTHFGCFCFG